MGKPRKQLPSVQLTHHKILTLESTQICLLYLLSIIYNLTTIMPLYNNNLKGNALFTFHVYLSRFMKKNCVWLLSGGSLVKLSGYLFNDCSLRKNLPNCS